MKIIEGLRLHQVMGQATIMGEGVGQIDFSKLIAFNTTAAYLWQSVEGKVFLMDDLITSLTEHLRIDPATA